jgi:hypothetical protein
MKCFTGTICAFLALAATIAPVSSAHQGNPNFKSEITSIDPTGLADGIAVTVKNFDDGLELVNHSGKVVVVIGYDGEPYLRFSPDGRVEVNRNSPSYYLNEDRFADVEVPERADPDATPEWQEIDNTGVSYWHDHRSHYMGDGIPVQVTDENTATKIFDYKIPLRVDGKPAVAKGTLTWVGSDGGVPVLPFVGLAFLTIAGGVWLGLRRRRDTGGDA